jgi:chorismate synthase
MSGSSYGTCFKITTWGESHGKALGVIVDGCPAGLTLSEKDIQPYLDRRKPGQNKLSTPRKEADQVEILSGIFEGKTTGSPISLIIKNTNQRSKDYGEIATTYRPGHADYTFDKKYGFYDYRGGGRSSGRETAARVAAGAIALKILNEFGIEIYAYTNSIGPISVNSETLDLNERKSNIAYMPDKDAAEKAIAYLDECKENQDSVGGTIQCIAKNIPVGLGQPVFDKLDANLAKAIMSIGAVKAIEFGAGIDASTSLGSKNNDSYYIQDQQNKTKTNNAGGILGGISNGEDLVLKAHIKPTPSIAQTQDTITKDMVETSINIKGRHDPIIVPRAVVVVESMVAVTLLDSLFSNMSSRMDYVKSHIDLLRS